MLIKQLIIKIQQLRTVGVHNRNTNLLAQFFHKFFQAPQCHGLNKYKGHKIELQMRTHAINAPLNRDAKDLNHNIYDISLHGVSNM